MLVAVAGLWIFMLGGMKRELVPGRWQMIVETFTGFIDNMMEANIGPAGRKYAPYVFFPFHVYPCFRTFFGLLPVGVLGLHPFTVTSHLP